MRHIFICRCTLLASALLLCLHGPAFGENLIPNGDFENEIQVNPDEPWRDIGPGRWVSGKAITKVGPDGVNDTQCLHMKIEKGGWLAYKVSDIEHGACYKITFSVISEDKGQIILRGEGGIPWKVRIGEREWYDLSVVFEGMTEDGSIPVVFESKHGAAVRIDNLSLRKIPWPVVRGRVFHDRNGNGSHDEGEPGVPGVQVNGASHVSKSQADGTYEVNVIPRRHVYMTKPAGWRLGGKFYQRLPRDIPADYNVDFALIPDPDEPQDDFSFLTYNDMHLRVPTPEDAKKQRETTSPADMERGIALLNAMYPKPQCVIDIGDMVDWGDDDMFKAYVERMPLFEIPFWPVVGNHEKRRTGHDELENYEKWIGPLNFSFDYGRYHFICLRFDWTPYKAAWLDRDLELNKDKPKLFFSHYVRSWSLIERMSKANRALAVFSGHWHAEHAFHWNQMVYQSSTSFIRAGGSAVPGAFKHVRLKEDKLEISMRIVGFDDHLQLIYPAAGSTIGAGKTTLKANVYDTAAIVDRVDCVVNGGEPLAMRRLSNWTWAVDVELKPGKHQVKMMAIAGEQSWPGEGRFTVAAAPAVTPKVGTSWPTFQANSQRTGKAADAVAPPLHLAWVANTGGRVGFSSPIVYDNRIYIGVEDSERMDRSGIVALNSETGEEIWHSHTDASVKHTVAGAEGKVFVVTSNGEIVAFKADTGEKLWGEALTASWTRKIQMPMLVHDGVLVTGTAQDFVAIDIETGKRLWNHKLLKRGTDPGYPVKGPAAVGDRVFGVVSPSPNLHAWKIHSGEELWATDTTRNSNLTSSIVLSDGNLIIGGMGGILHMNAQDTGDHVNWVRTGTIYSLPAMDGLLAYTCDNREGRVKAVDLANGEVKWTFQTKDALAPTVLHKIRGPSMIASPVLSGNTVYVGADDGWFYALDSATGEAVWSHYIGVPVTASAAVSGNAVFVSALDGNVYAFVKD